jgi:hypothetical protein
MAILRGTKFDLALRVIPTALSHSDAMRSGEVSELESLGRRDRGTTAAIRAGLSAFALASMPESVRASRCMKRCQFGQSRQKSASVV